MDDLNLLREFGRELELEPPATLARRRDGLTGGSRRRLFARPRGWVLLGGVAAITAAALVVPTVLLDRHAGEIRSVDVGTEPVARGGDVNVLLLGSDSRAGSDAERSDTIMLAHLPAGGRNVRIVSFPRDLVVDVPACRTATGGRSSARRDAIGSAYSKGGPSCTVQTVETITGIRINHFIELDFTAVKKLVDAVGGVEIVLPEAVDDDESGLRLDRGRHVVDGATALAYLRLRHGLGDGSDLDRIKRQQQFLASLLRKARPSLANPLKLTALARAGLRNIRADDGLTVERMVPILKALGHSAGTAKFSTVPWADGLTDRARLRLKQPQAEELFKTLR